METQTNVLIVDDHPSFRACARALLEADGFTVVGEAEDGATALTEAIKLADMELVQLLLDAGADVNSPNLDGQTALMLAISGGSLPIAKLLVERNEKAIADGSSPFKYGVQKCCGLLKTQGLLDALAKHGFDAAFGGARREEEKSRAKERVYSFRDSFGQWDPKNQRPELWDLYNSKINEGESIRVFPLSNWTELDIWLYIEMEKIPALRDPSNFDLAVSQFSFPSAARLSPAGSPGGDGSGYCWSERRIDAWLADMRTKAEQIQRFI